jgi:septal ring factor EnvC (AmiA/AmiB activator)
MSSHLAEGTQVSKLSLELLDMKTALAESASTISEKETLIESTNKKLKRVNERAERNSVMADLLKPLSKDKRELMSNLLESVATSKLTVAYDKYIGTVLNETVSTQRTTQKLNESRTSEITGDKTSTHDQSNESNADIINLKKLAGIS